MYKKALASEIKGFTGLNDPYEVPLNLELTIETESETPKESLLRILGKLEELGYLQPRRETASEESA